MDGQKVQTPDPETRNGRGGAEIRNPDANRKMVAPKVQQTHGPGAAAEKEKLPTDTKCTVVQFGRIAWMIVRIVYKDSVGSPNNADALTGDAL